MARPKSTTPKKAHLNLTVTEQTKAELVFIASHQQQSISELVAMWAEKESRRLSKKTGKQLPDGDQLSME